MDDARPAERWACLFWEVALGETWSATEWGEEVVFFVL